MTEGERLTWFAGVYEGEGCIILHGDGIRIVVTQRDEWLINQLHEHFGGRIYQFHDRKKGTRTNPNGTFREWRLANNEALQLMFKTFQYLSPKRQAQILKVLESSRFGR